MKKLSIIDIDKKLLLKNIKRVEPYCNVRTPITLKCLIDGCQFKKPLHLVLYHNVLCPKCRKNTPYKNLLSNEYIDKKLIEQNKQIKRIGNNIKSKIKIEWECLIDGNKWFARVDQILAGHGCPKCAMKIYIEEGKKHTLTNEIVDEYLIKKNKNIKRIGHYINNNTKIEWECLICNQIWDSRPVSILCNNSGCPNCKNKNEKIVNELILKCVKNIKIFKHIKTYQFNNRKYFVDFYLKLHNGTTIIIEYNGEQHYKPVRFCGISIERANKNFEKQKLRDLQLKEYCKLNNIFLLEIPYWMTIEEKIETLNKINDLPVFK